MHTVIYESNNMRAELSVHQLHEELQMARVGYTVLDLPGVDRCNELLSILEDIMANVEED